LTTWKVRVGERGNRLSFHVLNRPQSGILPRGHQLQKSRGQIQILVAKDTR
jgi:hypothetical protein